MFPKQGAIAVGSDGDLSLFDPDAAGGLVERQRFGTQTFVPMAGRHVLVVAGIARAGDLRQRRQGAGRIGDGYATANPARTSSHSALSFHTSMSVIRPPRTT